MGQFLSSGLVASLLSPAEMDFHFLYDKHSDCLALSRHKSVTMHMSVGLRKKDRDHVPPFKKALLYPLTFSLFLLSDT